MLGAAPPSGGDRATLAAFRADAARAAVFADIDGTLAPVMPTPDDTRIPATVREHLGRLRERFAVVAAVTGRKALEARELLGIRGVEIHGNHGFEVLRDGDGVEVLPEALPYLGAVRELERRAREVLRPLGAHVEEKGVTASVHYRNAPPEVGRRCVALVEEAGAELGLVVTGGRGVIEARPPVRASKGTAVRRLVETYRPQRAMFLGDDLTDLDAFRELQRMLGEGLLLQAVRVGVRSEGGPREIVAEADVVAEGVGGVEGVLGFLAGDDE